MTEPTRTGTRQVMRRSAYTLLLPLGGAIGFLLAVLFLPARTATLAGAGRLAVDAGQPGSAVGTTGLTGGASVSASPAAGAADSRTADRSASARTGPGAGVAPRAAAGANVRGVTDAVIKIGITVPDVGAVKFLGPAVDNGNPQQQMEAVLDGWKRQGLVPVNGRDVQFVYRRHGVSSAEESRAACVGFADESKVFAVGAMAVFLASECVAKEYKIPIVTTEMLTEPQLQRSAPYLFSARPSMERMLRNWVHWAHSRRLLQGKQLGLLYYSGNPTPDNEGFVKEVRAELATLGYRLADQAALDGSQSSITVAVQRFRNAGVDLVMPVINSIDQTTFIEQADAQAYRPTYIDSDFQFNTYDLLSAGKHDGTYAMEIVRYGEQNAGMGLPPEGTACVKNYERYSGKTLQPKSTEEVYTLTGCDTAAMLLKGLQAAGRNLTAETFMASVEKIRNLPMALNGPYTSLYANRHHGGESQRTMIFKSDCRCWWALGAWAPLFVP